MKGPITVDFLEKGTTVNGAFHCQLLKQNSPYLLNKSHIIKHTFFLKIKAENPLHFTNINLFNMKMSKNP